MVDNIIAKFFASLFEQFFKVEDIVEQIKRNVDRGFLELEKRLFRMLRNVQRYAISLLIDIVILLVALICGILGIILVLDNYVPLEYVLLGVAALGLFYFLLRQLK